MAQTFEHIPDYLNKHFVVTTTTHAEFNAAIAIAKAGDAHIIILRAGPSKARATWTLEGRSRQGIDMSDEIQRLKASAPDIASYGLTEACQDQSKANQFGNWNSIFDIKL